MFFIVSCFAIANTLKITISTLQFMFLKVKGINYYSCTGAHTTRRPIGRGDLSFSADHILFVT